LPWSDRSFPFLPGTGRLVTKMQGSADISNLAVIPSGRITDI